MNETESCQPGVFRLWDASRPFPAVAQMPDLDCVTHVSVEKAQPGGYHYLHESSPAWHKGNLYVSYTQGKEDCVLSIVPIRVLEAS